MRRHRAPDEDNARSLFCRKNKQIRREELSGQDNPALEFIELYIERY